MLFLLPIMSLQLYLDLLTLHIQTLWIIGLVFTCILYIKCHNCDMLVLKTVICQNSHNHSAGPKENKGSLIIIYIIRKTCRNQTGALRFHCNQH